VSTPCATVTAGAKAPRTTPATVVTVVGSAPERTFVTVATTCAGAAAVAVDKSVVAAWETACGAAATVC
jgi:hypothetical protein